MIMNIPMDSVFTQEVIICTKKRRGEGKTQEDPIRIITEVFTKEGELIAEYDPISEIVSINNHK